MPHEYDDCPAKAEVDNLKRWQKDQNGELRRLADAVGELCNHEARRAGAEGMLKWLIGIVGFSGIAALASLLVNVLAG
ncbi:MAG: hypothetical protein JXA87_07805 [Thermoleophilia bacterium]|nr:hypothetical protein [Thermoleophilia bacterium]